MNWIDTNTLIAICTCVIALTQFALWKHIAKVKAYESEKGKNLATKEDIGDITTEIKSIESKFMLVTNIHTGILLEERNAIIDFNEKYSLLIESYLINWRLNSNNNKDLDDFSMILEKNQELCNIALSKFELFIDDEELNSLAQELIFKAIELEDLRSIVEEIRPLNTLLNSTETQERKIKEELVKRKVQFLKSYQDRFSKLHKDIPAILKEFQRKCRNRIYKSLMPEL